MLRIHLLICNAMMNAYMEQNDNKYAIEKNELSNILTIKACINTKDY